MEQKCDRLYPSAPLLENIDLEKRLEKKKMMLTVLITMLITLKKLLLISKTKTINQKRDIKIIKP